MRYHQPTESITQAPIGAGAGCGSGAGAFASCFTDFTTAIVVAGPIDLRHVGIVRHAVAAPCDELDGRGQGVSVAILGPGCLDVRERDGERIVVLPVSVDIAGGIDDAAIEDRVGRGVTARAAINAL